MSEDKFLGEPSNSKNSRSLLNNHNNTNANSNNNNHRPSSSTSSSKQNSATVDDLTDGDDIGWWDCSLCTYRNSNDKFKCEICDLRRGTSTRKPRCNADTIVAQVVKQQEQIRQQTKVKPPKVRTSNSTNQNAATTSLDASDRANPKPKYRQVKNEPEQTGDDSEAESVGPPKPKRKRLTNEAKPRQKQKAKKRNQYDNGGESTETSTSSDESTSEDSMTQSRTNPPCLRRSDSETSISSSSTHTQTSSSSSFSDLPDQPNLPLTAKPNKATDNPYKTAPLEVSGSMIKYLPPTSSGRTGLIIDKKRFTQHSVTVNDITITFTEFATRQNKYVRKKKRRRDTTRAKTNGNHKNRTTTKSETKSNLNTATNHEEDSSDY